MIRKIANRMNNFPILKTNIARIYIKIKYHLEFYLRKLLNRFPETKKNKKEKPIVIQLPITYKCNFDCVMCGMQTKVKCKDFSPNDLDIILKDRLFSEVISVGVNGGEPFIKRDLVEYIEKIIDNLPKLKKIYIISNGYFTNSILDKLAIIKEMANEKDIEIGLSLSLDGVGKMQDYIRGAKGSFEKITNTIDLLIKNKSKYVDYLDIICTITKYNIYYLSEVEAWARKKGIEVAYNIATIHNRIYNYEKYDDFTVLNDALAKKMTEEFFYEKFRESYSQKYFCLYKYLQTGIRYASCSYQDWDGVTITPNGQLSYCATFSKELGNAVNESAEKLFRENKDYQKQLIKENCDFCSHYSYSVQKKYYKEYIDEILKCI